MSIEFKQLEAIERKKELLNDKIEAALKAAGWTNEMVGWYWMWKYQLTLRGVTQQLTALSVEQAWKTHHIVVELENMIEKEAE